MPLKRSLSNAKRLVLLLAFLNLADITAFSQDISLAPLGKFAIGFDKEIDRISFSADGMYLTATDTRGNLVFAGTDSNTIIKSEKGFGKTIYHEFLNNENKAIVVQDNGELSEFEIPSFTKTSRKLTLEEATVVTLDPNQLYLTWLTKNDKIEIFDLKAGMTQARLDLIGPGKNTMFLGFDRFGQQLVQINNLGETYNWELIGQKFLRQLTLQSGEYSGSRSVIHAAATSQGADHFVVSLQEIFIPKGGLKQGQQPERRNMIIAYDWVTGAERKRVPIRYRADGMAMGPVPSSLFYYSSDSRTIFIVNLDAGAVKESVAIDEKPTAMAMSDDGEILAVGSDDGIINLYEIIRNNPAEIRIINPSLNRNYGEQTIDASSVILEGKIEGERITEVKVNDSNASLGMDGSFQMPVNLLPGKNRIRIAAKNSQNQVIQKDIYLNSSPTSVAESSTKINSGKRLALVIGNAQYSSTAQLRNTLNDAQGMAKVLKDLDFEVTLIEDGSYEDLKNAVYAFGDKIRDVDISLFFYAGHGLEVDGVNYLVPVDATIESHLDIKQKCIPLTGVLNTMEFANDEGLNLIILDACRNNPFPAGRRGGAGLARVNAPSGTLIAYSTAPGSVASDGTGENGLYTGELIKQLKRSQRIEDIFMNTRNNVEQISAGRQKPWEEARLKGIFFLK